ncbi:maleylpyruvate isomerase family mycothiol-dependent enzyme [Dactylosporangium aurantiacum]|uniref:Maleylpyruvate isomerase family mycothiol-dependent enzyme n=1 Tax=Dactylosporangium aurantiacum TaxID=35754 RepID=A0A9Q9IFU8_9ACTN|nr:maleylpyruvate isomerase family mycothiol-dependent enzyme [Dactylosporangium aurantiacum]MDG6100639.1 maleylpyruvate isomerase family mycothiol-dependent enzyme [Dactylosporangium aurantiacum]UWZ55277.1 maleylpyruvate isomerase family mycothiol-dependent enzyme [Dactylosporangium aurantiacum]
MSKPQLTKEFWLTALRTEGDAFRAALGTIPLDAPVPTCPGWQLRDLAWHLTQIYVWVNGVVPRGVTDRPDPRPDEPLPTGVDPVVAWTDAFTELVATLDAVDPDLPAFNWAPQAKKASFWHRRMAHETAVHRWDAQMAGGLSEPIEPKLASDGVTEVLDSWLPAGRRSGPTNRAGMIALHGTDVDHVWYVRLRGAGVALLDTDTLLDTDDHHERATASGPASDLVLALYGRVAFDTLLVSGDTSLLEGLRTG